MRYSRVRQLGNRVPSCGVEPTGRTPPVRGTPWRRQAAHESGPSLGRRLYPFLVVRGTSVNRAGVRPAGGAPRAQRPIRSGARRELGSRPTRIPSALGSPRVEDSHAVVLVTEVARLQVNRRSASVLEGFFAFRLRRCVLLVALRPGADNHGSVELISGHVRRGLGFVSTAGPRFSRARRLVDSRLHRQSSVPPARCAGGRPPGFERAGAVGQFFDVCGFLNRDGRPRCRAVRRRSPRHCKRPLEKHEC